MTTRRAAVWFAVFAVVVFAAGLASGVLLDRLLGTPPPIAGFFGRGGPNPARIAARLSGELSLTADQRTRVERIFTARREQVRRMHRDLRAQARSRFEAEQASLRSEIRAVLTPAQQVKFDAMLKAGPERFWPGPGRFLGGPPPAGPPEP